MGWRVAYVYRNNILTSDVGSEKTSLVSSANLLKKENNVTGIFIDLSKSFD